MEIATISLFPEIMQTLNFGVTGRAINNNILTIQHWQLRDFTDDKHQTVDDRPYGGGPGMVMLYKPLEKAITAAKAAMKGPSKVIYLSPQGKQFNQSMVQNVATNDQNLILVAGRYEGVDQRLINSHIDEQWSIGDYVLSGGEIAACVVIDTIARLLPGTLNHSESAQQDSFSKGLLDHPHYTRPEKINGLSVPNVLLMGDHSAIANWRLQQALGATWLKRPDLLTNMPLNEHQQQLLADFMQEQRNRGKNDV